MIKKCIELRCLNLSSFFYEYFFHEDGILKYKRPNGFNVILWNIFGFISLLILAHHSLFVRHRYSNLWGSIDCAIHIVRNYDISMIWIWAWIHDAFDVNAIIAYDILFFLTLILLNPALFITNCLCMLLALRIISNNITWINNNILNLKWILGLLLIRIRILLLSCWQLIHFFPILIASESVFGLKLSKRAIFWVLHQLKRRLLIAVINYKRKSTPQIKGIAFYINWWFMT